MHEPCTCWYPQKSEDGVRFLETGVRNSGEATKWVLGTELGYSARTTNALNF